MLVPIEQVPLGARVPTKNPKPWEYDDSLPEPDQATWAKLSITITRGDGAIIDIELIRPGTWIKSNGFVAGNFVPINIPELEIAGHAIVTAIGDCPLIADGEGSVVTGRFLTREVNIIVRAEIMAADGTIEIIEGTPIHPIWSLDRNDWVPLRELKEGEQLQVNAISAFVAAHAVDYRSIPVFNVEVHGQHVFEVGFVGALVHNATDDYVQGARKAVRHIGKRMRSTDDALQQLDEIEIAQRLVRQGKSKQIIDQIEKSEQRAKNALDSIRHIGDL